MVCNQIVVGIRDAKLSQKHQMDAELTLEKVTQLVRESETIKLQQATLCPDDTTDIGAVTRKPSWHHGQQHKHLQRPPPTQPSVTCTRCTFILKLTISLLHHYFHPNKMPLRVQHFRVHLMRYQYSISHVASKELCTADTLSRAPVCNSDSQSEQLQQDVTANVNLVIAHIPTTEKRLLQIQKAQEEDPICQQVKLLYQNGWPGNKKFQKQLKPYAAVKFELNVVCGLLLRGSRIIIPSKLHSQMIKKLYTGYQGLIIKVLNTSSACNVVAWHWQALEEKVSKCPTCCQYRTTKIEPLIPSKLPDQPWQKVATDLFKWQKSLYLLVVDYYSCYIETIKLSSTTSTNIISHLKSIFSRHGIPTTVMSDNGSQYSSKQFVEFSSQYGFSHITSSPKYPQSNGEAE